MVEASHSTTMPPAPYTITEVLFSTLSHCRRAGRSAGEMPVGGGRRRAPPLSDRAPGRRRRPRRRQWPAAADIAPGRAPGRCHASSSGLALRSDHRAQQAAADGGRQRRRTFSCRSFTRASTSTWEPSVEVSAFTTKRRWARTDCKGAGGVGAPLHRPDRIACTSAPPPPDPGPYQLLGGQGGAAELLAGHTASAVGQRHAGGGEGGLHSGCAASGGVGEGGRGGAGAAQPA